MFKQIAVLFLITAFVTQTFSGGLVMLDYYTNSAAFAKNCENKSRPKMHCNGKCQMMKKLKQEQKEDQQNPEKKGEIKIQVLSSKSFYCSSVEAIATEIFKPIPIKTNHPLKDISYSFFHPPQA